VDIFVLIVEESNNFSILIEMQPPPAKKLSRQHSSSHKVSYSSSTKNSSKKSKSGTSKKKKRVSTSSSSASGGESDVDDGPVASVKSSSNQHRSNSKLLGDTDLWKVSEVLSNNQWRVLGRNLGLDESAITNIDQSFKGMGTRECAYQVLLEWKSLKSRKCTLGTLYKSLEDSKMFAAAKNIANMKYDAA
jgi:Death domain